MDWRVGARLQIHASSVSVCTTEQHTGKPAGALTRSNPSHQSDPSIRPMISSAGPVQVSLHLVYHLAPTQPTGRAGTAERVCRPRQPRASSSPSSVRIGSISSREAASDSRVFPWMSIVTTKPHHAVPTGPSVTTLPAHDEVRRVLAGRPDALPSTVPLQRALRARRLSHRNRTLDISIFSPGLGADTGRKAVKIAGSGVPHGLRAKLGRLFSSPSGGSGVSARTSHDDDDGRMKKSGATKWAGDVMPTLYLSHGSPMLPIQMDDPARQFIVRLPTQIAKPRAVVIVSAHWNTSEPTVNSVAANDTIHDFYGFPKQLYQLRYDAPGDPALAERVVDLLKRGGFPKAKKDEKRGLDHGAWVPLLLMYPNADVPVVQLSVQYRQNGAHHYRLGQALAPLKKEGVLVIGSGSATHNLGEMKFEDGPPLPWAQAFDDWLNDALVNRKDDDVVHFAERAPEARKAHPSPDHFLPAIVALGAAGDDAVCERIHSSWCLRSLSMASFSFETPSSAETENGLLHATAAATSA